MPYKLVTLILVFSLSQLQGFGSPDLSEEIDDFFHDPEVFDFRIAPGGVNVSYAEYFGKSRRSLITIDFEKGEKRGLEARAGEDIYSSGWVSPDRLVYTKAAFGSTRYAGVFVCKTLIHDIRKLDTIDILPKVIHPMPEDPELCAVFDVREKGTYKDLQYLNVTRGEYVRRVKNPGNVLRYFLDTKGDVRLGLVKGEEEGEKDWLLYDSESSAWSKMAIDRDVADWRFFDDGPIAFAELTSGERVELQQFDLEKGAFVGTPLGSELADVTVDGFIHDPTTSAILGLRIEEPKPRIQWFDSGIASLAIQLEKSFAGALVTFLGANSVNNDIFFKVESDVNPGSLFAISQEGKVTPLGHVNSKVLRYKLPRTELISFENRRGVRIHGYLTLPHRENDAPVPLLVIVHGGPHSLDKWQYGPERQFFAHKGFAVLNVNYSGSSGFGKSFWEQDGFESILRRSIDDVIDGTRWAFENYEIDERRVAIMGGSYGGYAAVEAVAREPGLYRCSVGFAGVYDWPKQLRTSRNQNRSNWDWFGSEMYGDLKENEAVYNSLSPVRYANKISVPVLLIHGKADFRVEEAQSKAMHKAINKAGGRSRLILDTWGRHGFVDEDRRVDFYREVYSFLVENTR
ncbi:peptidase, S9A/B/C family, catalytic domain protein [Verrucomicrobiia bacterium DG1235]|nr:peptidase, S9A/B/C family, catalytic domain protein [Verrucomicrobiae bacterium DG1235]